MMVMVVVTAQLILPHEDVSIRFTSLDRSNCADSSPVSLYSQSCPSLSSLQTLFIITIFALQMPQSDQFLLAFNIYSPHRSMHPRTDGFCCYPRQQIFQDVVIKM